MNAIDGHIPAPARLIADLSPYALADAPYGAAGIVSLAQNESLRPPSPRAREAARDAAAYSAQYPDPDWTELRAAVAETHDLNPDDLLFGAGSMELIGAIAAAFLNPGDAALTTEHGYLFFRTATRLVGGRVDLAQERDRTVDVDALLARVGHDTRIVFVANPGNPTGTRIPVAELERLCAALPSRTLLVVDEAYGEFAPSTDREAFRLVARGDAIVLRTFSKAYGLAGMRVGWGAFPPGAAREVRKILNPNNVGVAAQAAATAAMRDQSYMRETVALTAAARTAFIERARRLGLDADESSTNFALLRFATNEVAAAVDAALRADGVHMRRMDGYGLGHCLRATIAGPAEMALASDALETAMRRARAT